ncbi:MAG: 3-methylornithyl-N6-L-lysine dehydrogenase PylD [Spirochaetes bacterium]|nr:3-methylornithyl-N6-L-lysine dehydrogenase PylD [Spirochaetota bacterium]
MTRLTTTLVTEIALGDYDNELRRKTGRSLKQIAVRGACSTDKRCTPDETLRVAVIPISSGKGVIHGFTNAVYDVTTHLGYRSFITRRQDVAGLAEALEKQADIAFLADDDCFIAINLKLRYVVYNHEATARGYAAALDYLAGGVEKKGVLVIGAGKVGNSAVHALQKLGAEVAIFDIDEKKAETKAAMHGITAEKCLDKALSRYSLLFDASPARNIIRSEHIKPDTSIAACGIPIGLTDEARTLVENRMIHDPLQIGVATMLLISSSFG